MIRIAICDDNTEELSQIVSLLTEYQQEYHTECEFRVFHNGFELISVLEKGGSFDIYCLDIIMPAFSGIELGKEIRCFDKSAQIIFLTSSPEFAVESYSVKASNYILKPITKERLFPSLNDALETIESEQPAHIVVKSIQGIQKILLSHLVYVEAYGRKVFYHMLSGTTIECRAQFSEICDILSKHPCFIKPHRSYLVNMSYIDTISSTGITLQTAASVPIAQGKTKEIKECYLAFQMDEP